MHRKLNRLGLAVASVVAALSCGDSSDSNKTCTDSTCREAPDTEAQARGLRASCTYLRGDKASVTVGLHLGDAQSPVTPLGGDIPIQYVFVLMLENRSFDSYFGRFQAYLSDASKRDRRPATDAFPTPDYDPRMLPFAGQEARDINGLPIGVDVPGTPYDLLSPGDQAKEDTKLAPNASSNDFNRGRGPTDPPARAPYNPSVAGVAIVGSCQKHYWRHANSTVLPDGRLLYATDIAGADQCIADTCHEWWCSHMQWDNDKMDGFFQSNDGYWEGGEPHNGYPPNAPLLGGDRAMLYYDASDIPFYYWLADNFSLADHYHASLLGPTWPNRDYLYAATSRGLTSNSTSEYGTPLTGVVKEALYGLASKVAKDQPSPDALKASDGTPIHTLYDNLRLGGDSPIAANHWVRKRNLLGDQAKNGTWYGVFGPKGVISGGPDCAGFVVDGGDGAVALPYAKFESSVARENQALLARSEPRGSLRSQCRINPVNFIDPDGVEDVNAEDEHPPGTPQMGQRLVWDVVRILMANPEVWKRSALFITYDEHGGFYDHVPPPKACLPDSLDPAPFWSGAYGGGPHTPGATFDNSVPRTPDKQVDATDAMYGGTFDRYGIRVPLTVVSPWAKHHYVSHYTYDHTSIVRFIEARFKLPALTRRDANADPLFDMFDFSEADAKLTGQGKWASWGTEKLPDATDPRYATVAQLDAIPASPTCLSHFPPASTPYPTNLGSTPYDGYDWSPGKPPPCGYDANGDCAKFTVRDLGAFAIPSDALAAASGGGLSGGLATDGVVALNTTASTTRNIPIVVGADPLHLFGDPPSGVMGGINDADMVAGTSDVCDTLTCSAPLAGNAMGSVAVVWSGGQAIPLGAIGIGLANVGGSVGSASSGAWAINSKAHVAGFSTVGGQSFWHGFLFRDGDMLDLGTLQPGEASEALALNESDVMAGYSGSRASRWGADFLEDVSPAGATQAVALAVNAQGWVAGNFTDASSNHQAFTTAETGVTTQPPIILTAEGTKRLGPALASDRPPATLAYGMGVELRPNTTTVDYDVVIGANACAVAAGSPAHTVATRWRSARLSPPAVGPNPNAPRWVVEDLNALLGPAPHVLLDRALAINRQGGILASGYLLDSNGAPTGQIHVFVLTPNPVPPAEPRAPLTVIAPRAVVPHFALSYTATFSATPSLNGVASVTIPDGHTIQINDIGGAWSVSGTISPTGDFTASAGANSISGTITVDPAYQSANPIIPALGYTWAGQPGTLTLTPN